MKRTLNALLLLLSVFAPSAYASPALDALPALAEARPAPVTAPYALYYKGFDTTGLPAYIFTEEKPASPSLVAAIDRTRYTLDIALYNLQFEDTIAAMLRAKQRGVKVRVIFDYEHVYPQAGKQIMDVINSGLETRIMKGRGGSGAMHCKYALFDKSLLETGSANWSNLAEASSYENMMFVADPHIVQGYGENFDWMWAQARPYNQQTAPAAAPSAPPADRFPSVKFNGASLPNYVFSPRGGTTDAMAKALDAAKKEVDVAMFAFTSRPLFDALKRAAARGVRVKLLLHIKSSFPFKDEAKASGMTVHYKGGRTEYGIMHNKFAVLDDALLINGSFNWSATAEDINTENTIFTTVPNYVQPFKAEFEKLFAK